jgi:hypothetical protein
MKREDIGAHTIVEAKLTPFGAHVLSEYLKAESPPDRGREPGDGRSADIRPPSQRNVEMPIWELLKIFGPHTVSSARLPFEDLSFGRQESKEERTHRDAERSRSQALDDLRDLAKAVGIGNAFMAPEIIAMVARQFASYVPPRVPNRSGYWWLGEDVVKVTEADGVLSARTNGRRRIVSAEQPWRGPAIVDARVRKPENDEDIPF